MGRAPRRCGKSPRRTTCRSIASRRCGCSIPFSTSARRSRRKSRPSVPMSILPIDRARAAITIATLLACGAHAQQAVILVRHAELENTPGLDARQVPLSDAGRARAQRLAALVANSGVAAIYATDFARTQQTAAAPAALAGREVTVLSKGGADEMVAALGR